MNSIDFESLPLDFKSRKVMKKSKSKSKKKPKTDDSILIGWDKVLMSSITQLDDGRIKVLWVSGCVSFFSNVDGIWNVIRNQNTDAL